MGWLFVPGSGDSNSDSVSPSETPIAVWVTSSGKGTLRPSSWRGWKTRLWIRLLSGTISRPSMASLGADSWISSLLASRVSHQAPPAHEKESGTTAGSGPTSKESFAKYDRDSSSWRTFRGYSTSITGEPLPPYSGTWPNSGTMRNGISYRQKEWAHRISGRGSSSSRDWQTPRAIYGEGHSGMRDESHTTGQAIRVAENWPTPRDRDSYARDSKAMKQRRVSGEQKDLDLVALAETWPTPRASPNENRTTKPAPSHEDGTHGRNLAAETAAWPTPRVPRPHDSQAETPGKKGHNDLTEKARTWNTPTGRDYKDDSLPEDSPVPTNSLLGRQVQRTSVRGAKSSNGGRGLNPQWRTPSANDDHHDRGTEEYAKRRMTDPKAPLSLGAQAKAETKATGERRGLNPIFVEWLMGWPLGWTDCGQPVTELSPWLRRWRSYISRRDLA